MCRKDMTEIRQRLFLLADAEYQKFHSGLCPDTDNIIGVRVPVLRNLAKEIAQSGDFLDFIATDCEYYEEIMLQGMFIGMMKSDFDNLIGYIRDFVPKIDNWAVCDTFCAGLKITKKNLDKMHDFILPYLGSEREFEVRFATVMLLDYYITEKYIDETLQLIDKVIHKGYYAKMAVAWAVSVCYVKFPDKTMGYLKNNSLDDVTYNKALSKICESLRVSKKDKEIIKSMKRK